MSEAEFEKVEFVTTGKLANMGGATSSYVRRLCRDGRLEAMKLGGIWLIDADSAQRWLRSSRKRGRPFKGQERVKAEQPPLLDIDNE